MIPLEAFSKKFEIQLAIVQSDCKKLQDDLADVKVTAERMDREIKKRFKN